MKKFLIIILSLLIISLISCTSNYIGLKSGENENTFYLTDYKQNIFGGRGGQWFTKRATIVSDGKIIIEEIPR